MSVSPAQNRSKPPPVPDSPTLTRMLGFSSFSSSAAALLMGKTVEEPSTATEPDAPSPVAALVWPPPQALSASPSAAMPGTIARRMEVLITSFSPDKSVCPVLTVRT